MKRLISHRWIPPVLALVVTLSSCPLVPLSFAQAGTDDEETLHTAGLETDGPSLLAFFNARSRADIDPDRLRVLLGQLTSSSHQERSLATAEFLGLGPLAVPTLRRAANDLSEPEIARRAAHCLSWLEGSSSKSLPVAAASVLGQRKPEGAAAALLAYLPFADSREVLRAVTSAMASVAVPRGKPDEALLRALTDPIAVRRAAAVVALCRAIPPDQVPSVRKLLKDPAPGVRLQTALALAEANDADAIPVLIDLLADLPIDRRKQVEEFLQNLAGEWAPALNFAGEDEVGRKIRRDAWAAWWRNVDGDVLLDAVRKRTPTDEDRASIRKLLVKLTSGDFATRETASKELFSLGRRSLPQLREAAKNTDVEVARRAKLLIERIEEEPSHHLPVAALRLLGLRKPPGSTVALLSYLPYSEDENRSLEVQSSLAALALHEGKLDTDLVKALTDRTIAIRATAAEALINGGGVEGRAAVRALLKDDKPAVRMRVALAMALARDKVGVPVLIDLLIVLPSEDVGQVEEVLYQLAGETAPDVTLGKDAAAKKKCRDAWAAWWKVNANRVDLARLKSHPILGFTLICDIGGGRVYEVDRSGKERWSLTGLNGPSDAVMVPGNHVLISEYNVNRVSERDMKGNIIWQKQTMDNPIGVQRLANGNTFIATDSYVVEVDRTGKELYTLRNAPMVHASYRMRNGPIVFLQPGNQCVLMDTTGKTLSSFNSNHGHTQMAGLDVLPNGHILVTQMHQGKVVEFDSTGKSVVEVNAPGARTATGLPNGHILVTSQQNQRVFEVDRTGKVVWEVKGSGPVIRARRR
jgi:HEAT repeat protein/outer membrane protein assembly factor BamB